jgi:hypothetical protein
LVDARHPPPDRRERGDDDHDHGGHRHPRATARRCGDWTRRPRTKQACPLCRRLNRKLVDIGITSTALAGLREHRTDFDLGSANRRGVD